MKTRIKVMFINWYLFQGQHNEGLLDRQFQFHTHTWPCKKCYWKPQNSFVIVIKCPSLRLKVLLQRNLDKRARGDIAVDPILFVPCLMGRNMFLKLKLVEHTKTPCVIVNIMADDDQATLGARQKPCSWRRNQMETWKPCSWWRHQMEHFRVTGPLCGEFTAHRWIPITKASNSELRCFLS